ncbi:MAG: hypothetical protein ACOX4N_11165 [Dethiobacteraceae bacterium]|jgi:hypothetical protein|nr:hypothetical protein [Bacillota bacterium]
MCHKGSSYEFAMLQENEVSKIREAEKSLSQNGDVYLIAYQRSDKQMTDE